MTDCVTKTCATCGQEKAAADFHKNKFSGDGLRSACKPCVLASNRQSVLRHHEKRKAEKRAVYYAQKHTPEFKARMSDYVKANKERKREYDREYRRRNHEKLNEQSRQWVEKNRAMRLAISRSYKARRRAQELGGVSTAALANWTTAQKKVCYWCGARCAKNFHVDHYIPLSKGGKHELANLVIACAPCNLRKNAKDPLDFAREVGRLL
jgi:5-methylcytosine-specific restriction endonuclease McrA